MGPVHRKTMWFLISALKVGRGGVGKEQDHCDAAATFKLVLRNWDKSELTLSSGVTLLKALHLLEGKAICRRHSCVPSTVVKGWGPQEGGQGSGPPALSPSLSRLCLGSQAGPLTLQVPCPGLGRGCPLPCCGSGMSFPLFSRPLSPAHSEGPAPRLLPNEPLRHTGLPDSL